MAPLSLKIVLDEGAVTRTLKFESSTTVAAAQAQVKEKILTGDDGKVYGLFLTSADDERSGVWLEGHRQLDYYMLRDGDQLHYLCRMRNLRVRLLDGSVRTLQVDESKTVEELMVDICARLGITNHDEYGLCHDRETEQDENKLPAGTGTLTLKRVAQKKERDAKLEQLSKKIKTDDNVEWLEQKSTLRELGAGDAPLLLKRRLFYSDRNVDARDPVQLNLLYVQARDAILEGRHPVTEDQAVEFAGIQCQVHYGDFQEDKHKPGLIENLNEYLPEQYSGSWGAEKKILKEYRKHSGLSPIEAKYLYTKTARDLPTYGVTFFLVKEKQKGKKKLVPRLLGINAESILRLDEVTKEILQVWPLTQVKTYHAGKSETFTLNFGDYSDKEYSVKTNDAHRIRDILQGYIDLIRRRMEAKWQAESAVHHAVGEEYVEAGRGHLMEHIQHNSKALVEETFVGPSKIISYEPGQVITQGTQIMTVQQVVVTDKGSNRQNIVVGQVPMRRDMSLDFVRKLNKLNSNSVKIVSFLAEPSESNIEEARKLVKTMEADMPSIIDGVHESAKKQPTEEARKKLLDELQELCDCMKALSEATSGDLNSEKAEDAAMRIADLSTQMYFSLDPRTLKRGELCRNYEGPILDASAVEELEKAAEAKMGKLNAAVALYLTAYADPKNVDYSAAVTSMNTINELLPELTKDAMMLSGVKDGNSRQDLLDEIKALCDAAKRVCLITDPDDHEKIQEAAYEYGRVSEKLMFTFRRKSPQRTSELVDLAKDIGRKTSFLVAGARDLAAMVSSEPAAAGVDEAGTRCADAAKDLLACATVTSPSIHEPHCQSALTAAAETLSSAAQHLAAAWKPLVEDPSRKQIGDDLKDKTLDLAKALDRLKNAFANLNGAASDDSDDDPIRKGQRLQFITTVADAKNRLAEAEDDLKKALSEAPLDKASASELQRKLAQRVAQLNAALAALVAATSDREKPDYTTADLAVTTITELMPDIVKDGKALSATMDEKSREDMMRELKALCDASRGVCEASEHGGTEALNNSASKFAKTSGKLFYVFNPRANQNKENEIMGASSAAFVQASAMLAKVQQLAADVGGESGAELDRAGTKVADAANTLLTSAQLTAPCIEDPRCQAGLLSSANSLSSAAQQLASTWTPLLQDPHHQDLRKKLEGDRQQLEKELERLRNSCQVASSGDGPSGRKSASPDQQRLQFITTAAAAKKQVEAAEKELNKPAIAPKGPTATADLKHRLYDSAARLNAAVAALVAAAADRENPDYVAADNAMNTINQLLPQVVKDTKSATSGEDDKTREEILRELRALCDAARGICETAGAASNEDLNRSAAKLACATGKLVYVFNPRASQDKEHEILDVSSSACEKASQLLNDVYQLAAEADGEAGSQLDGAGSKLADAANALLTTAQLTAPCMEDPRCQASLVASANAVSAANQHLASTWLPVVQDQKYQALGEKIQKGRTDLDEELERLKKACRVGNSGNEVQVKGVTRPALTKDPKHLKFVSTAAEAESVLQKAEKELDKPIVAAKGGQMPADLQNRLAQSLAQLNAAIAALLTATADREKPDYETAEQSIQAINQLMPQVVKDTKALSASKDEKERQALLDELRSMCEATRGICSSARDGNHEDLNSSAAKLANASSKLVFQFNPRASQDKDREIINVSSSACGKASQLLNDVYQLAAEADGETGAQLDGAGSKLADAANALLTTAQLTAPCMEDPRCQASLVASANAVSAANQHLASTWLPVVQDQKYQALGEKIQKGRSELEDELERLKRACRVGDSGNEVQVKNVGRPAPTQGPKHLKFVSAAEKAESALQKAEMELDKPIVPTRGGQIPADLQSKLAQSLAQLNAAIAALLAATADREKPDYETAEQSIQAINQLMPQVVKDTKALSAGKDDKDRQVMLDELRNMCEATRGICSSARDGNHENMNYNAVRFGNNSGKLFYVISPQTNQDKEHQIIDLSSQACEKATMLLTEVYQLAAEVGGDTGAELDSCGSNTADAAKTLLATAQLTAPSIHEPRCQAAMLSAADALSSSAQRLAHAWAAPAQLPAQKERAAQLEIERRELEDAVEKIRAAVTDDAAAVKSPTRRAPPPPPKRASHSEPPRSMATATRDFNQEFLHQLRCEESQNSSNVTDDVAIANKRKTDDEKALLQQFGKSVDAAALKIKKAEEDVNKIYSAKDDVVPALSVDQTLVVQKQMEQKLSQAAVAAANLVASNHPDSIDLVVASKSTATLSELMPHIVQDAKLLRGSLNDEERKRFVADIVALFEATKNMLEAAKEDRKKLDKSAVEFGNKSAKLLYVVSTDVDPGQEKEVLERVRNINENASRLAVLGADSASDLPAPQLQALCRAGARAAGAATTLAYTAKLVAPSIQNAECNEALTNAANDLSTHLQTYSSTWAPLEASPQSSSITELRTEAASLERLLEELRRDLGTGKLVKRRTVERVVVEDTPLRRLACVVQEEAKKRAESTNTLPELRAKYAKYANELGQVVKQLDLAYHRCRQAPQDLEKRQELEYAVQNLQITLLQTRPSLDGTPQSNIVDLTEYVKEVSNDADKLIKECEKGPPELTNTLGSIQERCSQIVSRAARLTTADSYDQAEEAGWMDIEQFAEECDQHLNGINYMLENLNDGKLKIDLQEKATRLSEDCNMLRFATKCALASSQGVSLDATLDDLTDLEGKIDEMLAEGDNSHVMPSWSSDYGRGRLVAATARAGAGIAHDLPPAFTSYMDDVRTRTDLSNEPERNQSKEHLRKVLGLLKALTMTTSRHVATWQPLGQPEAAAVTGQILKELDSHHSRVNATKGKPPSSALADLDMNQLLYPPTIKVEGDQKQISDKLQQAASKLSTATSTIMQSAHKPESLSRSAHAAAAAAAGLAAHARALRTNDVSQIQKIDEATKEMSLQTYNVLKTADMLSQEPNNIARRRKLLDACRQLNDAINQLVKTTTQSSRLHRECGALTRSLQLQQALLAAPLPAAALRYGDAMTALQNQRDVIQKLSNDEPMSREEFARTLSYVSSAVCNSTEYAAQCAYLLAIADQNKDVATDGFIDASRIRSLSEAVQDTCHRMIRTDVEQAKAEELVLSKQTQDLQQAVSEAKDRSREGPLKDRLAHAGASIDSAAKALHAAVNQKTPDKVSCIKTKESEKPRLRTTGASIDSYAKALHAAVNHKTPDRVSCMKTKESEKPRLRTTGASIDSAVKALHTVVNEKTPERVSCIKTKESEKPRLRTTGASIDSAAKALHAVVNQKTPDRVSCIKKKEGTRKAPLKDRLAHAGASIDSAAKALHAVVNQKTPDRVSCIKTKNAPRKPRSSAAGASIDSAAKALHAAVNQKTPERAKLTSYTIRLLDCVKAVDGAVESASLAPEVKNISADAKARSDEVLKNTRTLNNNMVSLVREVRAGEDDDPMTWVTFGTSRKAVLDAFEALFNSVKENGKRAGVLESSQSDDEEADQPKKSYVQIQLDLANKWLARPTVKPDVKTAGEEASKNIIKIGEQLAEDLKDNEREEMLQLTQDSKALLTDCSKKYDNQKARALMERLKELKKSIERGVVTRIVEDFLEGHEPLADLDILAEIEKDETKRKFLLERKIAELLAHLARVSKTARIAAGAGSGGPQRAEDLIQCSDQTELLAPMLVKAAQQRVMSPDDKAAIEHYQKLLAEYAESLTNMRNLCDQAVDPMDFVQTAGETMQRLREDTAQEDDPQKCAYASTAITKLANRVINVSMSSNDVRKDPELQKLLKEAKEKLKATVPPPNARASRVPDWKVTTAEILRTTGEVESVLGGEMIFNKQQGADQPIFAAARDLHSAVRGWSARDNDIVAVAKRMAVLMAKLSDYMNTDRKREVLSTSKAIVMESHEVAELARKLANECTDVRIKSNLLQVCERIPTISGQLKMLATVKGSSLGHQDLKEDQEDMIMLVGNAQNLMLSVQEVVKAAASASVKIESQRGGPRMRWVRKNYY